MSGFPHRFPRRSLAALTFGLPLAIGLAGHDGVARGQAVPAQAAAPAAVAPFPIASYLDESAIVVAEADLSRIDVDAAVAWMTALLKQGGLPQSDLDMVSRGLVDPAAQAKRVLAAFAEAGGRKVYLVGMVNQQAPFVLVLPPVAGPANAAGGGGGDAAKLAGLFSDGKTLPKELTAGSAAEVVGGAAVWGPPAALAAVKEAHGNPNRQPRPDLAAALAAAGDSAVRVGFAPPEHVKGLLAISAPTLPPEVGGGPTGPVVNAFKYLTLAIDPPRADAVGGAPKAAARLTVQARDATGAQKLMGVVEAGLKAAGADRGVRLDLPARGATPNVDKLLAIVTPTVVGDKLVLALDQPAMESVTALGMPALFAAREQARRAQSASNLRQLALCVIMYANDNKGRLPEKFPADLAPYLGGDAALNAVLVNPSRPGKTPGYVFVVPEGAKQLTDVRKPAETIVLYEAYEAWPAGGIATGFIDGHSEWIPDEASFKRLVAKGPEKKE